MPIKGVRSFTKTVQEEFNKMVAYGKPCAVCARTFERMECSHIISIGSCPALRFDVINTLPMCANHHIWWWHDNPTDSGVWYRERYPDRWKYLEKARQIRRKFTIEDLQKIRELVKNREVNKLHYTIDKISKV